MSGFNLRRVFRKKRTGAQPFTIKSEPFPDFAAAAVRRAKRESERSDARRVTAVLFDGSTVPIAWTLLPGLIEGMRLLANPDVALVQGPTGELLARRNDRGELVLSTIGAGTLQSLARTQGGTK